ncbi:MAG: biotin--[acetyl-CoA-carboxylase] ligase [Acidobacteria bacterium]|nr:biotin--[acetyl-CoA-carboxylase] ligase [Acidobacteriota bacterium]
MMESIDVRALASRLSTIESVVQMSCATSTNTLVRRIADECMQNDIRIPEAIIIAGEQREGRGRGERTWHSPAGKGIYATALHALPATHVGILPLRIACMVASFLREAYAIDARIKWPNDILVDGRKIAGILIEARIQGAGAYAMIGVGINVFPSDAAPASAVSIEQVSKRDAIDLRSATIAFVEQIDRELARNPPASEAIARWRELSAHKEGDRVSCHVGTSLVEGTWYGIDDAGRAQIRRGSETIVIAAGDIVPIG